MEETINQIKKSLKIINDLTAKFGLVPNPDGCDTLLYTGVAESDILPGLTPVVETYFGLPYKPAGESAFLKNWFDSFVESVGGIRTEQTLYRREISADIALYCAFWPWSSNPIKTSVRIGLICPPDQEDVLGRALEGYF